MMKRCSRCKLQKDTSLFNRNACKRDGRDIYCRDCRNAYSNKRYRDRPDVRAAILKYHKEGRAADPAKYQQRYRDWLKDNKDAANKATAIWRQNNLELAMAQSRKSAKAWKAANLPRFNAQMRKRTAKKLKATPWWADDREMEKFYYEAARLTKETGIRHEVDHIVPLQSKIVCGLHCPANLRVIPELENMSKGNRWWPDGPDSISHLTATFGAEGSVK